MTFFAGKNFLERKLFPRTPFQRTFKRKHYFGLHSALKRIKLNFILFREDNILPYGNDMFSIVGEAISLPFASMLAHFGRGRRPRRPILDFLCHPERSRNPSEARIKRYEVSFGISDEKARGEAEWDLGGTPLRMT